MKTNLILVTRHDHNHRRAHPIDLRKRFGPAPTELPAHQRPIKFEGKPKSTSKGKNRQPPNFKFCKSVVVGRNIEQRNHSGLHLHQKAPSRVPSSPAQLNGVEALRGQGRALGHYNSADRDSKKIQSASKHKSYLMDYLNQPNHLRNYSVLSEDKKHKRERVNSEAKSHKRVEKKPSVVRVGYRTKQGVLSTNPTKPNQDSMAVLSSESGSMHLFSVADGHGPHGHMVSQLATKKMANFFSQRCQSTKKAGLKLPEIYEEIQKQLFKVTDFNSNTSGSTMVTLLLETGRRITCANVGDSRALLARQIDEKNWEIIHLSEDHKPSNPRQRRRILRKGGNVHSYCDENGRPVGPQRVWLPNQNVQGLAMSRSLGDNVSKPIGVTHEPELTEVQLTIKDKFLVLASDGVWQFISNVEVLQLVVPFYRQGKLQQCCDALMQLAYERWTVDDDTIVDDITFVLVFLE